MENDLDFASAILRIQKTHLANKKKKFMDYYNKANRSLIYNDPEYNSTFMPSLRPRPVMSSKTNRSNTSKHIFGEELKDIDENKTKIAELLSVTLQSSAAPVDVNLLAAAAI